MSLCVRCSAANPDGAARCVSCGSVLPRVVGIEDESSRLFSLEEGRSYPPPSETFDSENLAQLRMAIDDYLDGGEPTQVRVWLKHIRVQLREFSSHGATQLNQALDVERSLNAEGDFHHHVGYLIRKGTMLCEQGLDDLDVALEQESEQGLVSGLDLFRYGNDHVCTALLMISERQELLEEAVARFAPDEES